jgi:hypothetical protein
LEFVENDGTLKADLHILDIFLFFNFKTVYFHLTWGKPSTGDNITMLIYAVVRIPMIGRNVVLDSAEAGSPQALYRGLEYQMEHSAFALIVIEDCNVLVALVIGKAAENAVEIVV